MRTIRFIQDVMIGVGVATAITLVNRIEVESSNMWAAIVMTTLSIIIVVERELRSNNQ